MRILIFLSTTIFLATAFITAKGQGNIMGINEGNPDVKRDTLPVLLYKGAFYFKTKPDWHDTTQNAIDSFSNQWYSFVLSAMQEPVLSNYEGQKEIYRFTWLRTFDQPVSVRIEKQDGIIKAETKVSDGAAGYDPGKIFFDSLFTITADEYETLNKKLDETGFWRMPAQRTDIMGADGAEWIIEVYKNGKYHVAVRWSPCKERDADFRNACRYFISLSRMPWQAARHLY